MGVNAPDVVLGCWPCHAFITKKIGQLIRQCQNNSEVDVV